MFRVEIFVADDHEDLKSQINEFFRERKFVQAPRFLQIATNGEATYALLVAWVE